jgi:hypothetical protein
MPETSSTDRGGNRTPTVSNAEHAHHVIDRVESACTSAASGKIHDLRTTFAPM